MQKELLVMDHGTRGIIGHRPQWNFFSKRQYVRQRLHNRSARSNEESGAPS